MAWRYEGTGGGIYTNMKTCEILKFEGGLSNASATLGVQDGAERGRGGGKPRLPHGKKSKTWKNMGHPPKKKPQIGLKIIFWRMTN